MKKQLVKWMVLFTVTLLAAVGTSAYACAETERVDCAPVPMDNAWHDYELAKGVYAWCPILLESNGRLSLSVQTSFEPATSYYITVLDENLEQICSEYLYGNGVKDPTVWTTDYDLTAGQYYVRVESWNEVHGAFRVKANFTPSQAHEQAGTGFDSAVWLDAETVDVIHDNGFELRGFLSSHQTDAFYADALPGDSQNMADFYRIQVEANEFEFMVAPVDTEARIRFTIFDSDYQEVTQTWDRTPMKVDLKDGTYYLGLECVDHLCGDYLFKCSWPGAEVQATEAPAMTEVAEDVTEREDAALPEDSKIIPVEISVGASSSLAVESEEGTNLRWGSSNLKVVVVSQEGMIIGVSAGTAVVAAIPENGTQMQVFLVTVR